jgi:hypothetical protein
MGTGWKRQRRVDGKIQGGKKVGLRAGRRAAAAAEIMIHRKLD